MQRPLVIAALLASLLTGCDMLGIETPEKVAQQREAEGKAIGGACRHAARAIEDCYSMNRKADKASVFAGWREMNDYMRENKIDPVTPVGNTPVASAAKAAEDAKEAPAEPADDAPRKADKGTGKSKSSRRES